MKKGRLLQEALFRKYSLGFFTCNPMQVGLLHGIFADIKVRQSYIL